MAGGRQRSAAAGGIIVKAGLWVQLTVGIVFMLWPMPCAHQLNTQLEDGGGKVQLGRLLNVYPALLVVFIVEQATRSTEQEDRVKAAAQSPTNKAQTRSRQRKAGQDGGRRALGVA